MSLQGPPVLRQENQSVIVKTSRKKKENTSNSGRDYLTQDTQRVAGGVFMSPERVLIPMHTGRSHVEDIPRGVFSTSLSKWVPDGQERNRSSSDRIDDKQTDDYLITLG